MFFAYRVYFTQDQYHVVSAKNATAAVRRARQSYRAFYHQQPGKAIKVERLYGWPRGVKEIKKFAA